MIYIVVLYLKRDTVRLLDLATNLKKDRKMLEIYFIRENLAVCDLTGIGSQQDFEMHGFRAHLQCVDGFDSWIKECAEVKCLPFDDGLPIPPEILKEAQNWLSKHWDKGNKILISCTGGASRSVAMAIGLLSLKTYIGFLNTCEEVFSKIPGAYPHPKVLVSVANYCDFAMDFNTLKGLYLKIRFQPPFPWSDELLKESLR